MNLMIKNMMKVWMLGKITIKFEIDLKIVVILNYLNINKISNII